MASAVAAPPSGPDLVATAFDTLHNLSWGDSFRAVGTIQNQGGATAAQPFNVNVYASPTPTIGSDAVYLGTITLPAGLAPGQSTRFDQTLSLPPAPIADLGTSPSFYVGLVVDPLNSEGEANLQDKSGLGQGFDTSMITITPHLPPNLVASQFSVDPGSATAAWGGSLQVTGQISNLGPGNAPATRARVVLTPAGQAPGGDADVTIGSLSFPSLPAYQTFTASQTITLPTTPPQALAGASSFTVSMIQDADFQANTSSPHTAGQGAGVDSATLEVALPSTIAIAPAPRADLAVLQVQTPKGPIGWGQSAQVHVTLENRGTADAGPFKVRFLLSTSNDPSAPAIFLGDASIPSLKSGFSQALLQTVLIPSAINGAPPPSSAQAHILVIADPEHVVDVSERSGDVLNSSSFTLQVIAPTPPTGATSPTAGEGSGSIMTTVNNNTSGSSSDTTPTAATSPSGSTATTMPATGGATKPATNQVSRATTRPQKKPSPKTRAIHTVKPGSAHPAGSLKKVIAHPAENQKGPHGRHVSLKLKPSKNALRVIGDSGPTSHGA
jgi:hypothetical protein